MTALHHLKSSSHRPLACCSPSGCKGGASARGASPFRATPRHIEVFADGAARGDPVSTRLHRQATRHVHHRTTPGAAGIGEAFRNGPRRLGRKHNAPPMWQLHIRSVRCSILAANNNNANARALPHRPPSRPPRGLGARGEEGPTPTGGTLSSAKRHRTTSAQCDGPRRRAFPGGDGGARKGRRSRLPSHGA